VYRITDEDIKYCRWITKKLYSEKNITPTEDDMQDAMAEMSLAATRFDTEVGVKFSSYAKPYLRKSMLMKTCIYRRNGGAIRGEIFKMMGKKEGGTDYDIMNTFYGKHNVEECIINKDRLEKAMAQFPDYARHALIRNIIGGEGYADIAKDCDYDHPNSLNKMVRYWCKRIQEKAVD